MRFEVKLTHCGGFQVYDNLMGRAIEDSQTENPVEATDQAADLNMDHYQNWDEQDRERFDDEESDWMDAFEDLMGDDAKEWAE